MSEATKARVAAAADRARLKDGVHIEYSPRRVRAYFDNQLLADSQRVLLVYESKRPPMYWFPVADVRMDFLAAKKTGTQSASETVACGWSLGGGGKSAHAFPVTDPGG